MSARFPWFMKHKSDDAIRMSYVDIGGTNYLEYIGYAYPNNQNSTNRTVWAIQKNIYDGTDLVAVLWANGDMNYNKVWDNRASYTY